MTDPKSRVQLPSERIHELMSENRAPYAAIVRYLDEQQLDRPCPPDDVESKLARIQQLEGELTDHQWAFGEAFGMMYEPDQGPTWPAGWAALLDRARMLAGELTALTAAHGDLATKYDAIVAIAAEDGEKGPRFDDAWLESIGDAVDGALGWNSDEEREGGDYPGRIRQVAAELAEARAELTRIKAELANSEASRTHYFDQSVERGVALSDAERTIAELKTDLAWERGWDVCRKAQMGAVVEAALAWNDCDRRIEIEAAELRLAAAVDEYRAAHSSAVEQVTPPELPDTSAEVTKPPTWCECENVYPPCPSGTCPTTKARFAKAEAPREIKLHSTWRRKSDGEAGKVWRVYPDGGRVGWADSRGYGNTYEVAVFRERLEWVSDPELLTREVGSDSGSGSDNGT